MLIMIVADFSAIKCMARDANNLIILLETVTWLCIIMIKSELFAVVYRLYNKKN